MIRILFILIFISNIGFSQTSMNMNLLGTYNYPNTDPIPTGDDPYTGDLSGDIDVDTSSLYNV